MPKTWFISGASRGLGRIWTEAALERGDRVAAAVRDTDALNDLAERHGATLLPLRLDVTDRAAVFAAVGRSWQHFGRVDVVLPAAGYGLVGAIEEVGPEAAHQNMETNFFGAFHVIQAALPLLRQQGGGHILPVSSFGGVVALPMFFQPTKWAVEAMGESLAAEVGQFGIKVTIIEPGGYDTTFFSPASLTQAGGLPEYESNRADLLAQADPSALGDPLATPPAIFAVVDAEKPPLRIILGSTSLPAIEQTYAARLAEWRDWAAVSDAAQRFPRTTDRR
jgi:NAD(P)-dependent dehydrogenase (short-subunit alcohol dehydrogenase family)